MVCSFSSASRPFTCIFISLLYFSLHSSLLLRPCHSSNQSCLQVKKMANARLARFITEVAPPQIVSVMRHRTAKVLDTITEEEREYAGPNDSLISSPKGSSSSASSSPSSPSFASAAARTDAKYFLKGVHRSLAMFRRQ